MLKPLPIERIPPPSIEDFYRMYVKQSRPVVIEGLVSGWPALPKWSLGFFAENYGKIPSGAIKLVAGECDFNTERGSRINFMPLQESIASIEKGVIENGLAIASPADVFPQTLQLDYSAPVYCANGKFLRSRVFIGPPQTITSLHQDLFENLYTIVAGQKRITLFAPSTQVYPNSRFSKLPNHSQIDIENPNYLRFPLFKQAQPYVVDLAKGETLFLPSFWWHHLRNLDTSIAVSFWWAIGWKYQ